MAQHVMDGGAQRQHLPMVPCIRPVSPGGHGQHVLVLDNKQLESAFAWHEPPLGIEVQGRQTRDRAHKVRAHWMRVEHPAVYRQPVKGVMVASAEIDLPRP